MEYEEEVARNLDGGLWLSGDIGGGAHVCAVTLEDCKKRDMGGRCLVGGKGRGILLVIG